jgi:hypothetical protein
VAGLVSSSLLQSIVKLSGNCSRDVEILSTNGLSKEKWKTIFTIRLIPHLLCCFNKALVHYLFGESTEFVAMLSILCDKGNRHIFAFNPIVTSWLLFLEGLHHISMARRRKRKRAGRVNNCLGRLRKIAIQSPHCSLARLTLLEAEMMALREANSSTTLQKYDLAVSIAKRIENPLLVALSNELTAKYLLSTGCSKRDVFKYMEESLSTYRHWGAHAKASHLQQELEML